MNASHVCDTNHHLTSFMKPASSSQFPWVVNDSDVVVVKPSGRLRRPKPAPSDARCLEYLSDSQLGDLFSVKASDIHADNIEASLDWTQGRYGEINLGPALKDGEHPSVAVIGDSHCLMWGESFDRLAMEYGKHVGFLCRDGTGGPFSKPLNSWDTERLTKLKEWQPEVVLWFNYYSSAFETDYWSGTLPLLLEQAQKVIIFGDVPMIPSVTKKPSRGLLNETVLQQGNEEGSFAFLTNLSENGKARQINEDAIRAIASKPMWEGRVKFIPVAPYFIHSSTKHLMLVDPCKGTLVYKDGGHLNIDGARRVEPLFRKEVFGQTVCES